MRKYPFISISPSGFRNNLRSFPSTLDLPTLVRVKGFGCFRTTSRISTEMQRPFGVRLLLLPMPHRPRQFRLGKTRSYVRCGASSPTFRKSPCIVAGRIAEGFFGVPIDRIVSQAGLSPAFARSRLVGLLRRQLLLVTDTADLLSCYLPLVFQIRPVSAICVRALFHVFLACHRPSNNTYARTSEYQRILFSFVAPKTFPTHLSQTSWTSILHLSLVVCFPPFGVFAAQDRAGCTGSRTRPDSLRCLLAQFQRILFIPRLNTLKHPSTVLVCTSPRTYSPMSCLTASWEANSGPIGTYLSRLVSHRGSFGVDLSMRAGLRASALTQETCRDLTAPPRSTRLETASLCTYLRAPFMPSLNTLEHPSTVLACTSPRTYPPMSCLTASWEESSGPIGTYVSRLVSHRGSFGVDLSMRAGLRASALTQETCRDLTAPPRSTRLETASLCAYLRAPFMFLVYKRLVGFNRLTLSV